MTPTKERLDVLRWRMRRVKSANGVTVPKRKSLEVMNALRVASAIRKTRTS